ncbi:MAG: hypothetical protein K2X03_24465 [Bryobacteraceae bacterium]|nr:hypothetical protein [Bryobacteraceae bacterium]
MAAGLAAQTPPPGLVKLVAERETLTEAARASYTYRQAVELAEWDARGTRGGLYTETREILFSPSGERRESFLKKPADALRFLKLTPEDFADLREVQPGLLTTERLPYYRVRTKGAETIDGLDCWVLALEPRQILEGQRFFEGLVWASQSDFSIIRTEGKAVPALVRRKNGEREENYFPRFSTVRKRMPDGFWLPVLTLADDDLPFRHGAVRIRLKVDYQQYRRFAAESTIQFGEPPK